MMFDTSLTKITSVIIPGGIETQELDGFVRQSSSP